MRAHAAAAILALSIHGVALSQERVETLEIRPPEAWNGWKQIFDVTLPDKTHVAGWVPPDQDRTTWKEAINVYTLAQRTPGDVTTEVIRQSMMQSNTKCVQMNIVRPKPQSEGPFTVAYGQIYCTERHDTKAGRLEFMKAIASERRVYLIIALRNVKPFQIKGAGAFNFADDETISIVDWLKQASDYLGSVRACIGPVANREACSR